MDAEILIEKHIADGNKPALSAMGESISKVIHELRDRVTALVSKKENPKEVESHLKSAEEIFLKVHAAISKIS